jgi:hypothetical protein
MDRGGFLTERDLSTEERSYLLSGNYRLTFLCGLMTKAVVCTPIRAQLGSLAWPNDSHLRH